MSCKFMFVVCLAFSCSMNVYAQPVKVILLGGQSNMDGRAPISGLPISPVNLQAEQTDVLLFHGNASGDAALEGNTWIFLAPGSASKYNPPARFGPEVTFGRAMADAYPNQHFALIKYALGGSKLATHWNPASGSVYAAFRTTVANGLAALSDAGYSYEISGMLWMQGESDSTVAYANSYHSNLTAFIADIRSRYGANLPFVVGETWRNEGDDNHPGTLGDVVSAAQKAVADADPYAGFVSTRTFPFQDEFHLDPSGQMNLGYGFAEFFIDSKLVCIPGDFNSDRCVDLTDFAELAAQWMNAAATPSADIAPPGGDSLVDILDLVVLCENWLAETW